MKKFIIAVAVVILAAFAVPAFAATNPFMDVPASHWAYDAVAQLAARGVISGYPDGSYKGAQPATRYEMASVVARAMARIDMEKASKQDVEMLKKLIVEFKDELDALGVKVDRIDARLAVMEKDLGGWSMSGQFRFDANFGMNEETTWYGDDMVQSGKNDFNLNRYRMFFMRRINETTRFTARIGRDGHSDTGGTGVQWERYFVTTELGYGITLTMGRNYFEWETDLGFVGDNDTLVGGFASNMFWFRKDWGMANLQFIVGRLGDNQQARYGTFELNPNTGTGREITPNINNLERFYVAGLANFDVNEKFRAGVMAYYFWADNEMQLAGGGESDTDILTVGGYMGFKFMPEIELKGIYYYQSLGDSYAVGNDDTANSWRVILDVDQSLLKFTSAWIEYGQLDNHFRTFTGNVAYSGLGADLLANRPTGNSNSSKIYGANLGQKWNDKWRTWARYYAVDYDTNGLDDATNWGLGVAYRLNPAVEFQLAYDKIDYGDGNGAGFRNGDDNLIRLRTFVTF